MKKPLSHQAESRVRDLILERGLRPGEQLPSEGEIATLLQMSKPSVREGVRRLETLGVVEVRHGRGLFVGELSLDVIAKSLPYSLAADRVPLAELLQVRKGLEAGLISAVLPLSTPQWLRRLDDLVAQMYESESSGDVEPDTDREFHLALFEPLGNHLILQLINVFWEAFTRASEHLPRTGSHRAAVHDAIVQALRAGDPVAATAAVHDHFADVESVIGTPASIRSINAEAS